MDIRMGVAVQAENGLAGYVQRVIIHPETRELVGVVVRDEHVYGREVVIPESRLTPGGGESIRFRGNVEELTDLEGFALSQYTDPPEAWIPPGDEPASLYLFPASPFTVGAFEQPVTQREPAAHEIESLDAGDVEISGSTTIYCRDGEAGHLDRVVTEPQTDHVTHLVVRRGASGRDHAVPAAQIERMGDEGIYLTLTCDELDDLPDFDD